jgi:hypothetical protein
MNPHWEVLGAGGEGDNGGTEDWVMEQRIDEASDRNSEWEWASPAGAKGIRSNPRNCPSRFRGSHRAGDMTSGGCAEEATKDARALELIIEKRGRRVSEQDRNV